MALALSALAAFAQDAMISPEPPTTIALPGGERVEQAGQPNKINSDQRWLGLYTTDALGQFGRGFPEYPGDNKVAISLTQEMLQPHLGSRVVGIRFGLCEPIGASRVFIIAADRYGNGKDIVSKKVDDTEKGWNTVMLDNPITITTKPGMEWMVGYDYEQKNTKEDGEYTSECYPFSCVAEGASGHPLQLYCQRPGTTDGKAWYEFDMGDNNLSVQLLIEGNYYQYDVAVDDFGNLSFQQGSEVVLPIHYTNNSTEDVSSIDYVVTIDGVRGTEQHETIDPAVIPTRGGTLSIPLPLGEEAGSFQVSVEVTKVNGHDNESESKVGQGTVGVFSDKYPRNLVIEEFTTEQCPNCPRVAGLLAYYMEHADPTRVWAVCHHSAYYTDWLTQPCDEPLLYLYNDNGMTYAPGLMFNRQPDFDAQYAKGNMDNVLFANTYDDVEGYADYQLTLFSNAQLSMQVAVNDDSSVATVIVSGECNESLDPAQNKLTLYLTEDEIPARDQYGASGDFYHMHVIRYFNSAWGDPVVWENRHFTATYSIPIDEAWNKDKLTLVAFLNKHNAEDRLDNRIENSIGMTFNKAVTALKATETSDNTYEVARYNAAGQRVLGEQKGLNIIKLSDGRTLKVMVP